MVWTFFGNGLYTCESGDTKITTGVTEGSGLVILNANERYYFTGGAWVLLTGGGGGSGEANTASNFGASGVGVWKDKNLLDLRFYKLNSVDNKQTIALNGTDRIDFTINQANLVLGWSQVTKTGSALGDIANIDLTGLANGNSIKWDSGTSKWIVYTPGTGGSGEINTASNFGTVGTGVWKDKSGVDLRFYKLNSIDGKLSIALNGTDRIDFTVNEGNLTLANLAGTIGDSKISGLAWGKLSSIPTASSTVSGIVELATSAETAAGLAVQADDTRLSNSRTPTTHNHAAADINSGTLAVAQGGLNKSTITQHALLKGGASNTYSEIAAGTENFVLAIVSGTPAWKSLDSERTGKAVASGNGSTTTFTIAHGLGAVPGYVFVDCSSHAIARTYTVDTTNITVVFTSAPSTGTNNVVIFWRVIA